MSADDSKSTYSVIVGTLQHIPGAALLFAVGPLLVLGYLGWYYYGADHLDQALYSLKQDKLEITPAPEWIKSDVLAEVYRDGRLDRVSLLDPSATATIAQAFETHDWVKSTSRVTKANGGRVLVDVVYRQPAAMVYYVPATDAGAAAPSVQENTLQAGFYPVDGEGVILPTRDFNSARVWEYFMIFARDARPAGDIGMSFGDARIAEALQLCQYLEADREDLGLQEVWVNHEKPSAGPSPWVLKLVTKDKFEIDWGHAPNVESAGEPTATEKRSRLISWLSEVRSAGSQGNPVAVLDLRHVDPGLPVATSR